MKQPLLFISHSEQDQDLVLDFIELLHEIFTMEEINIICTSIPKYSIRPGVDINQYLKNCIQECDMVLGFITPNSMQSAYVLFELGGAWVAEKAVIPILCHTTGLELVRQPLKSIQAVKGYDYNSFSEFVLNDLASSFNLVVKDDFVPNQIIQRLVSFNQKCGSLHFNH